MLLRIYAILPLSQFTKLTLILFMCKENKMKKFINDPFDFVEELTEGIIHAHPDYYRAENGDLRVIVRQDAPVKGKVAIATGGGSGHLPVFMGYVGKGLADGACIGNVFSSPSAGQMKRVTKAIDSGAGVLYLYGRYQGDMMNFNSAAEESKQNGIQVETVVVSDDIASAPPEKHDERRGVAGIFFAYKIAGAMADEMASLDEVKRVTQKAVDNTRSLGVALGPCTIPLVGKPNFEISDDEMEIGMGQHGEGGGGRGKILSADETAKIMFSNLAKAVDLKAGETVYIIINGTGATTPMELAIVFRAAKNCAEAAGAKVAGGIVDELLTVQEMAGFQMILCVADAEEMRLIRARSNAPYWTSLGE